MPSLPPSLPQVDKSALTGEADAIPLSVACTDVNHHETKNMCYFGTLLTEGEVEGIVVATGNQYVRLCACPSLSLSLPPSLFPTERPKICATSAPFSQRDK